MKFRLITITLMIFGLIFFSCSKKEEKNSKRPNILFIMSDDHAYQAMYRLYVLDKVRKGQEDVEQGRLSSADDLRHEVEKW